MKVSQALHTDALALIILSTLSLVLYSNTFSAGYVWDDRAAIIGNNDVQNGNLLDIWRHDFWGQDITLTDSHKSYRPLTVLSYRINYALHQFNASGYHIMNVLLHVGVVCLFYVFSNKMTSQFGAFIAALLFAVHPVHVESVASIVGRADVLCGMFYLLALMCYYTYVTTSKNTNDIALAYIFALCSCLAKELGFTIFGLFVVLDIFQCMPVATPTTSLPSITSLIRIAKHTCTSLCRSPLLLCRIGLSLLYLTLLLLFRRWLHGNHQMYPWTIMENHITLQGETMTRILSYAQTHVWYAVKLIYPYHLCFDYGYHCLPIVRSVFNCLNVLPLFLYSSLLCVMVYCVGHHRQLLFALCLLVFSLFPALNILFPVGTTLAERLLYIPSMGYCLAIGIALDSATLQRAVNALYTATTKGGILRVNYEYIVLGFLFPILISQSFVLHARNNDWLTERSLYASALDVCPNSVKALNNNGMMELSFGDLNLARVSLLRALDVHSSQASAYVNLGVTEQRLGNYASSVHAQQRAMPLTTSAKPYGYIAQAFNLWAEDSTMLTNADIAATQQHLKHRAASALEHAFALGWAPPSMLFLRANLHISNNEHSLAVPMLLETLRIVLESQQKGKDVPAQDMVSEIVIWNQLALCYSELRQLNDAEAAYFNAIASDSTRYEPHVNLASLYRTQGRYDDAIKHMQLAEEMFSASGSTPPLSVLYNAGLIYIDKGAYSDAKTKFSKVKSVCATKDIRAMHNVQCSDAESMLRQIGK